MTIQTFRDYILRQLGYPFHNIEMSEPQIFDCITEAVDRFTERHYDAVTQSLYKLQLVNNKSVYTLPTSIKTVINVYPGNNVFSNMSEFENLLIPVSPMPQNDYLWKLSDLSAIYSWRMSVKMWEDAVSNQDIQFDFNYTMHKLSIMGDMSRILANTNSFYLMCYECADDSVDDIYNNRWVKKYAVALSKKLWAMNLKKYNSAPLPGGAELNHEGILSDANEDIQRLEEQLEDEFTLPPIFFVG